MEGGSKPTRNLMFKNSKARIDDDETIWKLLTRFKARNKGVVPSGDRAEFHKFVEDAVGEEVCQARLKKRILELQIMYRKYEISRLVKEMELQVRQLASSWTLELEKNYKKNETAWFLREMELQFFQLALASTLELESQTDLGNKDAK